MRLKMIRIEIEGDNAAEVLRQTTELLNLRLGEDPQFEITEDGKAALVAGAEALAEPEPTAPKRSVGRPRKQKESPVGADPASPAGGESDNTGSAAPALPPAGEPVSTAAAGGANPTPAAASITAEAMKAKLQTLVDTIGGHAGVVIAANLIKKYGYVRIREIKPEHFAAVAQDAEAALAEHQAKAAS